MTTAGKNHLTLVGMVENFVDGTGVSVKAFNRGSGTPNFIDDMHGGDVSRKGVLAAFRYMGRYLSNELVSRGRRRRNPAAQTGPLKSRGLVRRK